MSKRCDLLGTTIQVGNNVSHSKRHTRRRFLPNLQNITFRSEVLGEKLSLRVTAATIRTVEHNGGIDNFLLTTSNSKLTETATRLKRKVKKAVEANKVAA